MKYPLEARDAIEAPQGDDCIRKTTGTKNDDRSPKRSLMNEMIIEDEVPTDITGETEISAPKERLDSQEDADPHKNPEDEQEGRPRRSVKVCQRIDSLWKPDREGSKDTEISEAKLGNPDVKEDPIKRCPNDDE